MRKIMFNDKYGTTLERLQDISEDDVLREGFTKVMVNNGCGNMASHWVAAYSFKLAQ